MYKTALKYWYGLYQGSEGYFLVMYIRYGLKYKEKSFVFHAVKKESQWHCAKIEK